MPGTHRAARRAGTAADQVPGRGPGSHLVADMAGLAANLGGTGLDSMAGLAADTAQLVGMALGREVRKREHRKGVRRADTAGPEPVARGTAPVARGTAPLVPVQVETM
jgi:hypothetical protein